jgi:hypothetical protein
VNVALRLISLSPPAFQPIHFAPRTQTAGKSSFSRRANLRATQSQNYRFVAPLFSWSYELLFPQTLYFQKHLRCPRRVPPKPLFRSTTTSTCRPRPPISFIINQLRTLVLSCRSFPHSHPLFSAACRLFVQKRGGGGTPPCFLCSPLSALCVSVFPGRLCATQRSLRLSVILWIFRCLCGESESPALLYPSFGGPKNADAR